jgi:branched-chain amino acid transport system permease protein
MILINAILALGLNIILKTGQVSLAHAAFFAVGSYGSAHFTLMFDWPFLVSLLASSLTCGIMALILGRLILHLKGVYFILVTFAVNELVFLLAKDLTSITGGNTGITGIKPPTLPIIGVMASKADFYYVALVVFLIVFFFLYMIYRSPFGRAMDSIRESENLASATGYDPMKIKLIAFFIGACIAGLGGSLFAHFTRYIAPFNFTFWESVNFLIMNIIGGAFSIAGPVIGAIILTPLPEFFRDYVLWQQTLYGLVLILFMRFLPDGVVSVFTAFYNLIRKILIDTVKKRMN